MSISVTRPIDDAIGRTRLMLFQPFDLKNWFVLGFCAFLARLYAGAGSGGGGQWNADSGKNLNEAMNAAGNWLVEHLLTAVVGGALVLLLMVGLWALIIWLSSRGEFMLLDGVARNRPAVREPWGHYRYLGNSLFRFRFMLLFFLWLATMFFLLLSAWIAWPDIEAEHFGNRAYVALAILILTVIPLIVLLSLADNVLRDFVAPLMYGRNLFASDALGVFARELLPGHVFNFVLFYLMKLVLWMVAALVIIIGGCLTCCIGFLPYIHTVLFLPVYVFFRAYPLYFLAQFGPEWWTFPEPAPEPVASTGA